MHLELNEEEVLVREAVERFAIGHCDSARRRSHRALRSGYSPENWRILAELGMLALPFATGEGGLGGGAVELVTLMEGLGRALAVEPVLEEIVMAGGLVARAGSAQQKARWLPGIISGSVHVALAHAERGARFGVCGLNTRARGCGASYLLEGEKTLVPQGGCATAFIVSARDSAASDPSIGFYLVDAASSGVERREFRLIDGSVACTLALRGAPAEKLPGGLAEFEQVADQARIGACAEMLGIMSRLLDATLDHVRTRRQFGAPLGSFQVIQHMLADLYVSLEQSRSQLYRAALCAGADPQRHRTVAGMKSYVSAAALRLGEQCIQLHGGMGMSDELPVGEGHRRMVLLSTLFGDSDYELERYIRLEGEQRGGHE